MVLIQDEPGNLSLLSVVSQCTIMHPCHDISYKWTWCRRASSVQRKITPEKEWSPKKHIEHLSKHGVGRDEGQVALTVTMELASENEYD